MKGHERVAQQSNLRPMHRKKPVGMYSTNTRLKALSADYPKTLKSRAGISTHSNEEVQDYNSVLADVGA